MTSDSRFNPNFATHLLLDIAINSVSIMQLNWDSIFESVTRLSSKPSLLHRAANCSWVIPLLRRSFAT